MAMDYFGLQQAVLDLEKAIQVYQKKKEQADSEDEIEVIKSGIIQNFEVCYELSWKYMKKYLEEYIGKSQVDGVSRKELFRIAAQNYVIDDVEKWFLFHEARNMTSHDYDRMKRDEVFEIASSFLPYALKLQERLEK